MWKSGLELTDISLFRVVGRNYRTLDFSQPLRPPYPLEQPAHALPLHWIDHFYETDATVQMRAEVNLAIAILRLRPMANAIGQNCFQTIVVFAWNIWMLVGDDSRQPLSDALAHDARLAVIHSEAFFHDNRRCMD